MDFFKALRNTFKMYPKNYGLLSFLGYFIILFVVFRKNSIPSLISAIILKSQGAGNEVAWGHPALELLIFIIFQIGMYIFTSLLISNKLVNFKLYLQKRLFKVFILYLVISILSPIIVDLFAFKHIPEIVSFIQIALDLVLLLSICNDIFNFNISGQKPSGSKKNLKQILLVVSCISIVYTIIFSVMINLIISKSQLPTEGLLLFITKFSKLHEPIWYNIVMIILNSISYSFAAYFLYTTKIGVEEER